MSIIGKPLLVRDPIGHASGSVASFADGAAGRALRDLLVSIEPVQTGSGDPSPDNVRLITGWTGYTLYRAGKNLFSGSVTSGKALNQDGFSTFSSGNKSYSGFIPVRPETTYYVYGVMGYNDSVAVFTYDITKSEMLQAFKGTAATGITYRIFTTSPNAYFIRINFASSAVNTSACLYVGSSQDAYVPFVANDTILVSWQTEAGTVYAGTVDPVTGVLRVRPYYASYAGETLVGPWVSSMDAYAPGATPTTGAQVVDLGGTETVYQLTPQQIVQLKNQNNVWADCGPILELEYTKASLFAVS